MREEDDQLYIYKLYGVSVPRRFKAQKTLRNKIGPNTKITDDQIENAQTVLDEPNIDFRPYAFQYIKQIEDAVNAARQVSYMQGEDYHKITIPLTQIKGQAAMFGNVLASELSNIILKFLEYYQRLDDDVLKILDIYCKSIRASYNKNIYNLQTPGGRIIVNEINAILDIYNKKFKQKTGR